MFRGTHFLIGFFLEIFIFCVYDTKNNLESNRQCWIEKQQWIGVDKSNWFHSQQSTFFSFSSPYSTLSYKHKFTHSLFQCPLEWSPFHHNPFFVILFFFLERYSFCTEFLFDIRLTQKIVRNPTFPACFLVSPRFSICSDQKWFSFVSSFILVFPIQILLSKLVQQQLWRSLRS